MGWPSRKGTGNVGGRASLLGSLQRSFNVKKFLSVIAAVIVGLGVSLALVGCSGSSATPTKDKMGGEKMSTDKMSTDKMGADKMSTEKMGGDKMKDDKIKDNK
jgi:pentapeptide MXKDX repeat protein